MRDALDVAFERQRPRQPRCHARYSCAIVAIWLARSLNPPNSPPYRTGRPIMMGKLRHDFVVHRPHGSNTGHHKINLRSCKGRAAHAFCAARARLPLFVQKPRLHGRGQNRFTLGKDRAVYGRDTFQHLFIWSCL